MHERPTVLPFFLPKVVREQFDKCCHSNSNDAYLDHAKENHDFSVYNLAWAIQSGVSEKCIERYLTQHNESEIADRLRRSVQTTLGAPFFPILYFAAERNSPEIVRILCHAGAKPSQSIVSYGSAIFGLPLLPYTILSAEHKHLNTTETVVALLAMAAQIERPTVREMQVAKAHKIMPLFEAPYHIFGQQLATTQVLQRIASRLLFNSQKPLVLFFTGLSGHGKTELARRMGGLLSLELIIIDCTMLQYDTDIFGPWTPYRGSQVGTQLNNHLVEWDGKRTVVFLDEFDKTTDDVRQAMLLLFESGSYTDRRNNNKIDCSKVLWILAANLGIKEITKFWVDHLKDRSHEQQKLAPIRDLQITLKQCVIQAFGAPLTGRFSALIPFLPFNEGERAITAYKFMRELWHDVRKPIDTNGKRFAGNVFVNFVNDGQIAQHIAQREISCRRGGGRDKRQSGC
ncbi:MAG: hypothetical protein Q9175_004303 [Cornicularia normoerica]